MVQTWGTADRADFTCPHDGCGARYSVKVHRIPLKDRDSATCDKCRKVMKEWNSTTYPEFMRLPD
ncbi:hypothetical protein BH09PSE1_BH09PSE1_17630 [soil metagenome]